MSQDSQHSVVSSYAPMLDYIQAYLLSAEQAGAFHSWVRSHFQPMMRKIGWTPSAGENDDTRTLRGDLIHILGYDGEDPETIQQATRLAAQYLQAPDSVDPSIAKTVLQLAARFGDEALFRQYAAALEKLQSSPEQYYNVAGAFTEFRDPKVLDEVLELSVSEQVRSQDSAHLIASALANAANQKAAWEWVKEHWPAVEKKTTMSSGPEIVNATRNFCSTEMRDDVQGFFTAHKVPSAERTLKQSFEDATTCVKTRSRLQSELTAWLQKQ
jgi:aminopeptidase N